MTTLTIRIDDELNDLLTELAKSRRCSKSDLVCEMLRRQLALAELRRTQALLRPYAERAGYLTDEDFFRDFS